MVMKMRRRAFAVVSAAHFRNAESRGTSITTTCTSILTFISSQNSNPKPQSLAFHCSYSAAAAAAATATTSNNIKTNITNIKDLDDGPNEASALRYSLQSTAGQNC